MKKGLELFIYALNKYDIHAVINNQRAADRCTTFKFFENDQKCFDLEHLYIITNYSNNLCDILQMEGNFLVYMDFGRTMAAQIGPHTNVITIPVNTDPSTVLKSILDCSDALKKIHLYSSALLDAVTDFENLDKLLTILSEMLENPVAVYDYKKNTFPAFYPKTRTNDPLWNHVVVRKGTSKEYEDLLKEMQLDAENYYTGITTPILFANVDYHREIITNIRINDVCRFAFIILENDKTFADIDFILAEYLVDILTSILPRHSPIVNDKTSTLFTFFDEIVNNKLTQNAILQKADKLGLNFCKENYLVSVFNKNKNISYANLMTLSRELASMFSVYPVTIYKFQIIIIVNDNRISNVIKKIKSYIKKKDSDLRACLSLSFLSAAELPKAFQQCQSAKKIGLALQADYFLYRYRNLVTYSMLRNASHYINLSDYCIPLAQKIIDYDKQKETEYAKTLYHYLKNFKDRTIVAKNLHVHFNTVTYRLERLVEIFDIDFDDAALLNNLALSFDIITCMTESTF